MKKSTILVVDDEVLFRRLYAELLREEGYQVEAVASGNEALLRLESGGIDIVLTDLIMPGVDGLEVLRAARSLDPAPEVILVTGHASLETAIQALKNGARDYLIKPFNPEELKHLVRTCLEQRRLIDENFLLKTQVRLFQRGQNLASQLDIDRLLPQTVSTLLQETGAGRGFSIILARNRISRLVGLEGVNERQALALARSLLPEMKNLTTIRLLRGSELDNDPEWPPETQTVCLFPLRYQKALRGVTVIFNPVSADFPTPIPFDNMLFLSEQAGLGFVNACRYLSARELIHTDDLTGLYNYRYLQVVLDQEITRAERYGLQFSLVFIDLDYFKNVNDTHGHLVGSNTLREVAGLLLKSVREVDSLFRYGGDEFTALLVETDSRGAKVAAERIRQAIEQHNFESMPTPGNRMTATVGFATFPENATDKKGIIDLADRAMYFGKRTRNVTRGAWDIKTDPIF